MGSNDRYVVRNPDGGWDVKAPGAKRASSHHDTQADAESAAKRIVGNQGGEAEPAKRQSSCAWIDLLGIRRMLVADHREAQARLHDLQIGLRDALALFPGGEYRACFFGDTWLIISDTRTEDVETGWRVFCGHILALSTVVWELERGWGNPGVRVVVARGESMPAVEGDVSPLAARDSRGWFVLTGANPALEKCDRAQKAGSRAGFEGNLFWFEAQDRFLGTPFREISPREMMQPNHYPLFFERAVRYHTHEAVLPEGEF